jgi:DNA-binding transcriptional regulator YdaS (Cro superfamily)
MDLVQLNDPGREETPPRLREDLKQRRRRAAATTEFGAALDAIGFPQNRVAKLFGISCRHVRRWRHGDRRVPRAVRLVINLLVTGAVSIDQVEQAAVAVSVRTNGSAEPRPPAPLLVEPAPAPAPTLTDLAVC